MRVPQAATILGRSVESHLSPHKRLFSLSVSLAFETISDFKVRASNFGEVRLESSHAIT